MGQTGSAQREPSMEEILASIRRIIQDSDTAQQPADGEPVLDVVDAAVSVTEEGGQHEVEAFRAELDEPAAAPPSMADIRAEVTRASPEPAAPTAEIRPLRAPAAPVAEEAVEPARHDTDLGEEEETAAFAPPAPQPPSAGTEPAEARPAIISDHAGRQVAAAFGELSEAFAASRRRSVDDMAQEMLRPMLQEWLDNNLPTLVERLVREEIERVARGD